MNELLLVVITLFTSILTAIAGFGGGMILIAFMPGILPPSAIVPIHALVQLCANSSRAMFSWRSIHWTFCGAFISGSVLGGLGAAQLINQMDLHYLPLILGLYILLNVWGPKLSFKKTPRGEFFTIGMIQTGLSTIIGATGPLTQSTLLRKGLGRDSIVSTSALLMTITHLIKIPIFGWLGFSFISYWQVIIGMCFSVITGTYIGTKVRVKIPEATFKKALNWLLTLLALRMVYMTLFV
jgi:uncharacterized membrane protein YfcA